MVVTRHAGGQLRETTRHAGGQLRETWSSQGMLVVNYVKHGRHKACWWSIT